MRPPDFFDAYLAVLQSRPANLAREAASIFYCKEVFTTYDKGKGHELRETKDGGIIYLGDDITLTEAQAIRLTLFPNQAHRGHTTLRDKSDIQLTVADRCLHLLVVRLETDALLVGQE